MFRQQGRERGVSHAMPAAVVRQKCDVRSHMINLTHDVGRDALSSASPLFASAFSLTPPMSSSYSNPMFPTPKPTGNKRKRSPARRAGKERATNDGETADSGAEREEEEETPAHQRRKKAPGDSATCKKKELSPSDWHLQKGEVPRGSEKTKVCNCTLKFDIIL